MHTTDKAQATASLEAVALAINEVVLRQMIESANTVVLADTTIIPIIQLPPPPLPQRPPPAFVAGLPAPPASVAQQQHQVLAEQLKLPSFGKLLHTHAVVGQGGATLASPRLTTGAPRHSKCKARCAWVSGVCVCVCVCVWCVCVCVCVCVCGKEKRKKCDRGARRA